MYRILILFTVFQFISVPQHLQASEKALTIMHTNDMHSHFLGASPNIDYTPSTTGEDETIGGWSRIATAIREVKKDRSNPVLVLDAGDFLMGTLYQMLSREQAFELKLLHMMGYDAVTLGNHEFDLKPGGLARILTAAHDSGQMPQVVISNVVFSQDSKQDDALEMIFKRGIVKPFMVLPIDGLRIGLFGLMGKDAAEVAPFASPVTFDDPISTAQKMVKVLKESENADIIICLSHGGLSENKKRSEDEILAKEVNGIDIIISGHSHTKTTGALNINDTIIVQAWEYGKQLGILDVTFGNGKVVLKNYRLLEIDDTIRGDPNISNHIREFETIINQQVLADEGLSFRQIIAETDFDLYLTTEESNLGNLVADAMRWSVLRNDLSGDPFSQKTVALISNGVIRDPIVRGKTGRISVCDAFRTVPLGIGFDEAETMGYPLITLYVYPSELKKAFEILTSIYPLKGSDYFLQVSGARFIYNPNRMIFDRVSDIWLGQEENGFQRLDYSDSNRTLVRITSDIYNATFLKIIGDFTWHILDIVPKDRSGKPIDDLKKMRLDADRKEPGLQEIKLWKAVMEYIRSFPDTDRDGLPNLPDKYRGKLSRNVVDASWNPYKMLKRGTYITWAAFSILLLGTLLVLATSWFVIRKVKR